MTSAQFRLFLALLEAFTKTQESYSTAKVSIDLNSSDKKKAVEILLTHSSIRFSVNENRLTFGAV